jgi:hypothetical protein
MEVLQREIGSIQFHSNHLLDTSIIELKDSICSHYKDSFIYGQEFENIESLGVSQDSSRIKSILIPYNPEEE